MSGKKPILGPTAQLRTACAIFAFAAAVVTSPRAEPGETTPSIDASINVWQSTGTLTWSHDSSAFEPLFGNPTSRLEYKGSESTIVELRAKVGLPSDYFAELAYGAGDAEDGRLTDQDFLSAQGAEVFDSSVRGEHTYSETLSDLTGDSVRYFDIRLGKTLFRSADERTKIDAALRYLNWREVYRARGVNQTICTVPNRLCLPVGFSGFGNLDVITNEAEWQTLFFSLSVMRRIGERFEISGELSLSPLAGVTSNDQHLLRADLATSRSFRHTGTGRGATAQIDARYELTPRLAAGVGFRYWWLKITNEMGGLAVFPVGSEPLGATLKNFESKRYGVVFSLTYTFGPLG